MAAEDCFMMFPVTDAHYRSLYDCGGYSSVAIALVFQDEPNKVQRNNPYKDGLSSKAASRLDLIRNTARTLCEQAHVPFQGMKPLDHGKAGVVVQVDDDYVVRIQQGKVPARPASKYVLPALTAYYDSANDMTFEVMDRLDVDCSMEDVQMVAEQAKEDGIIFFDKTVKNVGRDKSGNVLILDPDSYSVISPKPNGPTC